MRGGKSGTEGNGFIGSGRAGGQSAAASVIISKGQKGIRRVRDGRDWRGQVLRQTCRPYSNFGILD